jgi:sugar fermentation stimulation protein A
MIMSELRSVVNLSSYGKISIHLKELIKAKEEGFEAAVLFVIQMKGVREFRPNEERDQNFTAALKEAAAAGVKILAYDCGVQVGKVWIEDKISVNI